MSVRGAYTVKPRKEGIWAGEERQTDRWIEKIKDEW